MNLVDHLKEPHKNSKIPTSCAIFKRPLQIAAFWAEAKTLCSKVADIQNRENPLGTLTPEMELSYRLFPAEFRRRFSYISPEDSIENVDFLMSNRGPCQFLVKGDGKQKRKFELTETYYAFTDRGFPTCFSQFLVSVRGRLCWSLAFREDVIEEKEARIYIDCINEVLREIVL